MDTPDSLLDNGPRGGEKPIGPLMFQGDHGPVAYRNIKISVTEGK